MLCDFKTIIKLIRWFTSNTSSYPSHPKYKQYLRKKRKLWLNKVTPKQREGESNTTFAKRYEKFLNYLRYQRAKKKYYSATKKLHLLEINECITYA